ncbi:hypothetical protein CHGG_05226 [Chaetomium globosum CBS 148.51]|uniref:Rhodopsin domain-containing protein n=1 Tax=Chaetomium globosum (strain ATCC 6205 / CBS 148.51 / DSM 1962 / NBRC 6347 / NRRL 1970) TaxID=306901 RepID=Q2GZ20_CHAGB|nr:uncharacterized protein CHGG_05226 [Chaetomium globosum CBS 148.51]EAQ88607.1 hypothetical protein CHGG_05226 [Chaetomium globosum CBS 148.51]
MRLPPPEVVASWPVPNYINPEKQGPTLLIVELTTLSIALICLGLRLYARKQRLGVLAADDWLMIAAAPFGIGVTTCVVLAFVRYGWDVHVWDLTFEKILSGRKVSFAAQALFVPATALAKLSILYSYLRLAQTKPRFRRAIYGAMVFVVALNVCFIFVLFFQCRPSRLCVGSGDAAEPSQHNSRRRLCRVGVADTGILLHADGTAETARRHRPLQLRHVRRHRGLYPCYWIHYVVQETYDVTWYGFHLWLWTALEVHLGIICGCVPWMRSLSTLRRDKRNARAQKGTIGNVSSVAELINMDSSRRRSLGQAAKVTEGGPVVRVGSIASTSTRRGGGSQRLGGVVRGYLEDIERGSIYSIPPPPVPVEPATAVPVNKSVRPAHAELRTDRPVGLAVDHVPPNTPGLAL